MRLGAEQWVNMEATAVSSPANSNIKRVDLR